MSNKNSMDSLFQLVHSLKRNMQQQIEALELDIAPMHVRVLKIINSKPQCTAVDIANLLDRDKAQVTRLLNTLLEQTLITKQPNPEDKRSQCLRLTDDGQAIMAKLANIDAVIFEKMKAGLSSQDLDTFQRLARLMTANLDR
ncbi:MarR family winged helix-turn-helix transcriptional regulator [Vibrio taketomensis]|uniref:MarR family winged helix-turn-helix transcriptional regulator n=1 Tax=Vibrio taketomensis TaxID=2572923 RepID=UPI00138A0EA7|nr:MarR family transcriptional regulator [Vibrio taketomensis]